MLPPCRTTDTMPSSQGREGAMGKGSSGGKGGGKGSGKGGNPGWPSTTGKPSGGDRANNPPSKK